MRMKTKQASNSSRKFYRSPVGKGINLGTRVEKQSRGTGSYSRKSKWGNRFED
jgi:hypothetical protein